MEKTLVLIKPDAVSKCIAGHVITDLYTSKLKMIGLKLVNVSEQLAKEHYAEHEGKPFFEKLVKHIRGELHGNENVIAIVYEGENAIQKIRELAGKTHPHEADSTSIRGKYGRIDAETDCFENVVHSSDSPESAEREIKLWFKDEELIE